MNRLTARRALGIGLLVMAACQAVAATPAPSSGAPAAPVPVVDVAPVTLTQISPQVRAPGTVVSTRDAAISAELPGRLVIVAEVGDRVKQGDTIAALDDRVWRLQRESDEAAIRRLQASLEYMERQQERLGSLARQNNMAQSTSCARSARWPRRKSRPPRCSSRAPSTTSGAPGCWLRSMA
jgi:multidrug efflux pump subunit AcrA (membrane-fusion protein)